MFINIYTCMCINIYTLTYICIHAAILPFLNIYIKVCATGGTEQLGYCIIVYP